MNPLGYCEHCMDKCLHAQTRQPCPDSLMHARVTSATSLIGLDRGEHPLHKIAAVCLAGLEGHAPVRGQDSSSEVIRWLCTLLLSNYPPNLHCRSVYYSFQSAMKHVIRVLDEIDVQELVRRQKTQSNRFHHFFLRALRYCEGMDQEDVRNLLQLAYWDRAYNGTRCSSPSFHIAHIRRSLPTVLTRPRRRRARVLYYKQATYISFIATLMKENENFLGLIDYFSDVESPNSSYAAYFSARSELYENLQDLCKKRNRHLSR